MPQSDTRDETLRAVQAVMKELFQLEADRVHAGARLVEDLDLDSIDAIDLVAKMVETTGLVFDDARLRKLRTVKDVIDALEEVGFDEAAARRARVGA
jgi:acyl carrier protein